MDFFDLLIDFFDIIIKIWSNLIEKRLIQYDTISKLDFESSSYRRPNLLEANFELSTIQFVSPFGLSLHIDNKTARKAFKLPDRHLNCCYKGTGTKCKPTNNIDNTN